MSGGSRHLDPADAALGADLLALTETLARHAHERWVRMRTREGWRYGPERDDRRREHPCLVDYDDLPESEKEYDRQMTLATLRALTALGYEIRKR